MHHLFAYEPDSGQQPPVTSFPGHTMVEDISQIFSKRGHKVAVFDARSPWRVSLVNHCGVKIASL